MLIQEQLHMVMDALDAIPKSQTAGSGNFSYKFRGIDDFLNAVHPLFTKYSIVIGSTITSRNHNVMPLEKDKIRVLTHLGIRFDFIALDGSFVSVEAEGCGIDSTDKATPKATSMALKYALIALLSIPTADISDADRDAYEEPKAKPALQALPHTQLKPGPLNEPLATEAQMAKLKALCDFKADENTEAIWSKSFKSYCDKGFTSLKADNGISYLENRKQAIEAAEEANNKSDYIPF